MVNDMPSVETMITAAQTANQELGDDPLGRKILGSELGAHVLEAYESAAGSGIDNLTGLANATGLNRAIERLMEGLVRKNQIAETTYLGVFKPDVQTFKALNDVISWEAGNECLSILGEHLSGKRDGGGIRITDIVARLGGDDFAVIAPLPIEGGEGVIETMVERMKQIGDRTSQEVFQKYGEEYNRVVNEDRGRVLKALRLPSDFSGDIGWQQMGIATLAIPARLMETAPLTQKYSEIKQNNPKQQIDWWAELFAEGMEVPVRETKELINRKKGRSVCNWDETKAEVA